MQGSLPLGWFDAQGRVRHVARRVLDGVADGVVSDVDDYWRSTSTSTPSARRWPDQAAGRPRLTIRTQVPSRTLAWSEPQRQRVHRVRPDVVAWRDMIWAGSASGQPQ